MTSCRDIQALLSLRLDEPLDDPREAAVIAHLRGCTRCTAVDADLRQIVARARELGPVAPPAHVWTAIEAAIARETRVVAVEPHPARPASFWRWPALSAAVAAAALVGWFIGISVPRLPEGTPPLAADADPAEVVTAQLDLAMDHYQRAIAELERLAAQGEGGIDPIVAASVRESLATLDRAIAESRTALADAPFSVPARTSLFEAMQRKAGVLEDAVLLINERHDTGDTTPADATPAIPGREL